MRLRFAVSTLILALAACAAMHPDSSPRIPNPFIANGAHGVDLAGIDTSVLAGDDFFGYANGAWLKSHEIPADRSSYGNSAILDEVTAKRTADLIQHADANGGGGADARKISDTYASFLDEAGIEAKGLAPLQPAIAAIAAISDPATLSAALGATLRADVDVLNSTSLHTPNLFGLWVAQDLDDPSRYSPFLLQGGLLLPDRDFYLDPAPRMLGVRKSYLVYLTTLFALAGAARPQEKAERVLQLEEKIARVQSSRGDTEDVEKGNNHWTRAQLEARAPGLDWSSYLTAARLEKEAGFVVWQPAAIVGISKLVKDEPLSVWKEFLEAHALDRAAPYLPKAFGDAHFELHGHALNGTLQQRERWKRAVTVVDGSLGEAVGKLYVEKYFPASEKARAEQMVQNELAAFAKRIDALDWMAPQTKERAKAKLLALKVGVGYPDKWRDYSGLVVVRGDALGNAWRAESFEYQRNLAKLGAPVDRGEWVMNPQLVNAVNLPAMNALNFPAAILQPPDFDPDRPAAMDYGAAGATIGHEISHSFDDQGALFDASGKLSNWWTKEDFAHFQASSRALVAQFDAYQPFPGVHVNGKQTVSENIADVAGLAAAFDAYRLSLHGTEAKVVQGLTGDQQFFVSFAQSWRFKAREAAARARIITDGHAPAEYRADTVRNLDAWYAAFKVSPEQKLALPPEQRVRVW
jgi:putative endopeptidase